MAINPVGLGGSNTVRLDFDAGTSMSDMVAAIVTEITSRGWAVFADVGPLEKVLIAPNKDAVTSKFAWLDATDGTYIRFRAVEAWDTSTSTPINPIDDTQGLSADTTNRLFHAPGPDLSVNGSMYVSAHPRWALVYSGQDAVAPAEGNVVAERTREHPLDTPTGNQELPPVVWMGMRDMEGFTSAASPRYISGPDWTTVPGNPKEIYTRVGPIAATVDRMDFASQLPGDRDPTGGRDPLSLERYPLEIAVGQIVTPEGGHRSPIMGRVFGVKGFALEIGENGDLVRVPADSEFFLTSNGSLTDHIVLSADNTNRARERGFFRFCIPS